jgi:iron-sulfur cluster repair protein YtfE (RIC family)
VNALSLLKEDHDKVRDMLGKLDQTTERAVKTREELFTKLKSDLEVHETIEEELLYPALKEHSQTKEIALEAWEEHHVVDVVMGEISETPFDDEIWAAKLTVMKENLEHHIEEEEGELFKQARDVIGAEGLEELGRRMEARKKELMAA